MFTITISKFASLLAIVASSVHAQIEYLPVGGNATPAWTGNASPVLEGNGVYISPDGGLAVIVSRDASVTALKSLDGTPAWKAAAPSATAMSYGGAFFCYGATPYVLYSYVESTTNVSTVVALNTADGTVFGSFGPMQGTVAGTPVSTEDCQYVMATHNVDQSKGYFTAFSFASPSTPVITYDHPVVDNEPFGAVGYYWSPIQGNFPGGELNTNDVFIWSFDTNPNQGENATVGTSQVFAFQLPLNPMSGLNVTLITGDRDYQAKTAPVITDGGLSMYWSVSRSKVYGWVGDGTPRTDFTTNGDGSFESNRGVVKYSGAMTQPSLSNSTGEEGFVVGTGASTQIWRLGRNFSATTQTLVTTAAVVSARLLVSPDDTFVYYATPAPDSSLYQVNSADLTESWKLSLAAGIVGDIAQTKNGARVIVADTAGAVTAFAVATADESLPPISAPPVAPTVPVSSPPVAGPIVSGPPATTGPSETTVPSISMAPSMSSVPAMVPDVPSAPTVPSTPSAPSAPSAPSSPSAPSAPSAPARPTSPTTPSAPASNAIAFANLLVALSIVATTTVVMMA